MNYKQFWKTDKQGGGAGDFPCNIFVYNFVFFFRKEAEADKLQRSSSYTQRSTAATAANVTQGRTNIAWLEME